MAIQQTTPVPAASRRPFWLGTVTLAAANTNYHIIDLVNALTSLSSVGAIVPGTARELLIMGFPDIDSSGGNTNDVLIGDANLSTTNFGFVLPKGANVVFRSNFDNVQLAGMYARSAGVGQKLCVTVMGS